MTGEQGAGGQAAGDDGHVSRARPTRAGTLQRAMRTSRVRIGLAIIVAILAIAVIGPLVAPHGETAFVGRPNTMRTAGVLFGTDHLGQDVWSRFLLGGRSLMLYATVATVLGVVAGAALGLTAAIAPGLVDEVLMRSVDVLLAIPQLLLVLVAMTAVGPEPWLVVGATAFVAVPRVARVTRGAAVGVAESDFVQASEALGESRWRIVRSDLVPNISATLLVETSIRFTYSIGIVASLAFLGFNPDVNGADWGVMVQENRAAFGVQPWGVLLPVVAIAALAFGGGLVADGVARASARTSEQR